MLGFTTLALAFATSASAAYLPTKWTLRDVLPSNTTNATSSAKTCMNLTLPVTIASVNNTAITLATPQTDAELVSFFTDFLSLDSNATKQYVSSNTSNIITNATYNIGATFCSPSQPSNRSSTVQHLVHGIGFDRSYWDFPVDPSNYSYVDVATAAGYSTLAIDRLGVGQSDAPNGTSVVQSPVEIEILRQINAQLRNGTIGNTTFNKIIHVGHSYGSILGNGLAAIDNSSVDALILTGYSHNSSFNGQAIAGWSPVFAKNVSTLNASLPNDYLSFRNIETAQFAFFKYPYYNETVLEQAYASVQPYTIGEIFTLGTTPNNATNFTGPVQIVTGNNDLIFCGGDCIGGDILSKEATFFPVAKNVSTLVPPNAGHALNLHYAAPQAFQDIQTYLGSYF